MRLAVRILVRLLALAALGAFAGGLYLAVHLAVKAADPSPTATAPVKQAPVLRVVFPEGFTRRQMAARVGAVRLIAIHKRHLRPRLGSAGYLRATATVTPPRGFGKRQGARRLEGFLFPATYDFTAATSSRTLVEDQLTAFRRAFGGLDLGYARHHGLSPYQVVIVASLIEREVRLPKERPLVAAVIYNRLARHMPLGLDSALRYGLDIPPTKAITQSELASSSPYNLRRHQGLPPTPVANPGLASLKAAAHPAAVDYLYFVRKADCKSDFFTASAQAFYAYPRAGLYCKGR